MLSVLPLMFQFGHVYSHFKCKKISDSLLKHTFSILMTKKNNSFTAPLWFLHKFTKQCCKYM